MAKGAVKWPRRERARARGKMQGRYTTIGDDRKNQRDADSYSIRREVMAGRRKENMKTVGK